MEIGQKLPEILGKDQEGKEIKLSDFKGKKLVLYIYPKDSGLYESGLQLKRQLRLDARKRLCCCRGQHTGRKIS